MNKNIAFIGGIHGVGKSTVCARICEDLNMSYLSASEVLKWKEMNADPKNKLVKSIPNTQDRLVSGLVQIVEQNKLYLLDGHYCLLDKENKVVEVPISTFQMINPFSLSIIIGEVSEIKDRLELRDKRLYDYDLLSRLQESEIKHAQETSRVLDVKLHIGTQSSFSEILKNLQNR